MTETSNKQKIFNLLEQQQQLEKEIEKAGLTTIKPLVVRIAKNQRQLNALMAMEIYRNG